MLTANPPTDVILQSIIGVSGSSCSTELGLVDGKKDVITLRFRANADGRHDWGENEIEISLAQDLNGLRSRKGDTGARLPFYFRDGSLTGLVMTRGRVMESKVWRSPSARGIKEIDSTRSVLLANSLIQARLPGTGTQVILPLDLPSLRGARVMELGAGTGLLGLILAPLVGFYTFTDLPELCRLIEKNINLNIDLFACSPAARVSSPGRRKRAKSSDDSKYSDRRPDNITVEPLDWVTLYDAPLRSRARLFPIPDPPFDLVLATDTIYNPALVSPFLATLNHYAADQGRTIVFIVMELRDEDVTREFLHQWINLGGWQIWRTDGTNASEEDIEEPGYVPSPRRLLDERFATWVAWKE